MSANQFSKDIEKVFKLVDQSNAIDEAVTFSNANAKFTDIHKNIQDLASYRLNPDFIASACNIVENLYDPSYKSDKKVLAVNMLKACLQSKALNYSSDDFKILDQIIESCHSNGQVVKITKFQKRAGKWQAFFLSWLSQN